MTVEERVAAFVKALKPAPICDDCIATSLKLGAGSNRVMARNSTASLGLTRDFTRTKNGCSKGGKRKLVTKAN